MSEHASTLRTMAAEFDATAKARAHQARMADGNAHQPNQPHTLVQSHREQAARFRAAVTQAEGRAQACIAGAQALEGRTP